MKVAKKINKSVYIPLALIALSLLIRPVFFNIMYDKILFNRGHPEFGDDGTIYIIGQNAAFCLSALFALAAALFCFYRLRKSRNKKELRI